MLSTQSQLCWRYPQSLNYSIKHSIGHPAGAAEAASAGTAESFGAAASAAGATLASANGGGRPPPAGPQSMHWHYRGEFPGGWRGYRRGFGARRLVWFGLGLGTAALYYRHKEKHRRELEQWRSAAPSSPTPTPSSVETTRSAASPSLAEERGRSWSASWSYTPDKGWHRPEAPVPPAPIVHPPPRSSSTVLDRDSAVLAALSAQLAEIKAQPAVPTETEGAPSVVESEKETNERRWRPWGRHHRREQRREAASAASDREAEVERLRQIVADLWEEKRQDAEASQRMDKDRAKAYARERLESLNKSLESLREALKSDEGKGGKLV